MTIPVIWWTGESRPPLFQDVFVAVGKWFRQGHPDDHVLGGRNGIPSDSIIGPHWSRDTVHSALPPGRLPLPLPLATCGPFPDGAFHRLQRAMTWYWYALLTGLIMPWLVMGKTIRAGFRGGPQAGFGM